MLIKSEIFTRSGLHFFILASWMCVNYTVDKKDNYETLDFSGINIDFNFLIHCPFTKNNTLHFTIYWTLN